MARTAVLDHVPTARVSRWEPEHEPRLLARVEVTLLGNFEVRVDGRTIPGTRWSRRQSASLVKLLALTPGRSQHREQVLDALWPDLDVDDAAPRLHKAAHYARTYLGHGDAVVLSADVVRLYPFEEVYVDARSFEQAALSAVDNGGVAAAKAALEIYGGVLLPHDLYEPWTDLQREHLARLRTELLHQAEDWHQALAADRSDERAHLALAQRYAERGDRAAALRQLAFLDKAMRHDLGLDPGERAVALRKQLLDASSASSPRP